MRSLVRDCLLRLCGRVIVEEGSLSREDVEQWLDDVFGERRVLLWAMPLELSTRKVQAGGGSTRSLHLDDIRPVCVAYALETAAAETLEAVRDDAHRHGCAGARRRRLPFDHEEELPRAQADETPTIGDVEPLRPIVKIPPLVNRAQPSAVDLTPSVAA